MFAGQSLEIYDFSGWNLEFSSLSRFRLISSSPRATSASDILDVELVEALQLLEEVGAHSSSIRLEAHRARSEPIAPRKVRKLLEQDKIKE